MASFGLAPVLLVGAAAYFLTTSLTGLRPEWREMDRLRGKERAPDAQFTPPSADPKRGPGPDADSDHLALSER